MMVTTLRELVLRCHEFGHAIAVRAGGHERTYADLVDRSARLARRLLELGLEPGDRVAIMVEDGIRAIEPHLAAALAGLVIVPVNARFRDNEARHIVSHSGARAIVHSAGVRGVIDALTLPKGFVRIDSGEADADCGEAAYEATVSDGECDPPSVDVSPDDLVMIGYTSGTTGRPKGAMMTNASAIAAIRANVVAFRVVPYGACAFSGSISFTALFWAFIAPHLFLGASIDFLQPGLAVERWFDRMEQFQSTFTFVPTPFMASFAAQAVKRPAAVASLVGVCHSASPATPQQRSAMVAALGGVYIESFGMTESLAAVAATTCIDTPDASLADDVLATIGRPMAPASLYAVSEEGARLPAGCVGELVIESPSLFTGYWQNDGATDAALRDGRYATGDLGHVDAHGYVYIDGRKADLIISGGMNVYPAEVEAVLHDHPWITDAAVVGIAHERWGEAVAAVVVAAEGHHVDADDVIRHVGEHLASYKKPTAVRFVDALPRNANLKVQKLDLKSLFR